MKANKTLGELAEYITVGYVGSMSSEYVDEGVPFLRSLNVNAYSYNPNQIKYISKEFHQKIRKSSLRPGDVVAVRTGNPGVSCVIPDELPDANCSDLVVIRCGDKLDPHFVSYYINSVTRSHVKNQLVGAIQKHFNIGSAKELPFPNLDKDQQISCSQALRAINKKIALNNLINTELEAMAKLIYDYWFVQFDFPDANGKPYKSSGGKMVYNVTLKRDIPEGWSVESLARMEPNIVTGKTPSTKKSENFNGNIPFVCIGDVRGNMHITSTAIALSKVGAETQSNKYIPEGAICVTCIASPGLVGFTSEESQTNQQLNTVVCSRFENRYYLYLYLKNYFRFAKAKSGNTFANMNKGDFSSIQVVKPRKDNLERFSDLLKPSIEKVLVNSKENRKLIELRDWLLPMLMNGQVTVNDTAS